MSDKCTTAEVLQVAVALLEKEKVDYFLVGGIAVGVWGEPRYTMDADFVIRLSSRKTLPFLRAAAGHGFKVDLEVALMNLDVSGATRLDYKDRFVDMIVGESEFDLAAMERRASVRLGKRNIRVATAEDLILYKLVALRDRDIDDIRRIITRQRNRLETGYLRKWAATLGEALEKPEIPSTLENLLH